MYVFLNVFYICDYTIAVDDFNASLPELKSEK